MEPFSDPAFDDSLSAWRDWTDRPHRGRSYVNPATEDGVRGLGDDDYPAPSPPQADMPVSGYDAAEGERAPVDGGSADTSAALDTAAALESRSATVSLATGRSAVRPIVLYDPEVATINLFGVEDYRPGANPAFYAAIGPLGLRPEVMQ